jgi:hypothetical protein
MRDLQPVARELRPTLVSLRELAPHLHTYFRGFDRLIDISKRSLPALREILDETRPLFRSLGPFLSEFNPIFEWLELNQHLVADFLGNGAAGTKDTVPAEGIGPNETGHYLRQIGPTGIESAGVHRRRVSSNRGNAYLPPIIPGPDQVSEKIIPNWDCLPPNAFAPGSADDPVERDPGPPSRPACFTRPNFPWQGEQGRFIHVKANDYR